MKLNLLLEKKLVSNGYKLTRPRQLIIDAFLKSRKSWLAPDEIRSIVCKDYGKIDVSTIYRNLDILTRLNILCKIDLGQGASHYKLNRDEDHHHHMICCSCGKVSKIDFCPLREMDADSGFDFCVIDHKFEVYGYCSSCRK